LPQVTEDRSFRDGTELPQVARRVAIELDSPNLRWTHRVNVSR